MDKEYLAHNANMLFGGGEPTILDGFEELMELLLNYGTTYNICSNGIVFSETILKALREREGQLILGIDAGSHEIYKEMKGADCFDRVWRNTQQYSQVGGKKVVAKIIIRDENVDDIANFVEMARISGVKRVCYDIDAYNEVLTGDVVKAAATVRYNCEKLGIETFMGESGTSSWPQNRAGQRINEAYEELVSKTVV